MGWGGGGGGEREPCLYIESIILTAKGSLPHSILTCHLAVCHAGLYLSLHEINAWIHEDKLLACNILAQHISVGEMYEMGHCSVQKGWKAYQATFQVSS